MGLVCLVTGGAGFLGCAISSALADCFDVVVAVDNLHPQVHANRVRPRALDSRVELIEADILNTETWDSVLRKHVPDVIIHLAAETGTGQSLTESTRHASVNVCGTTVMLDALARSGRIPEHLLLSSSRAVYGEGAWRDIITGNISYPGQRTKRMLESGVWDFAGMVSLPLAADLTETHPTSIYGATKLAQEHVMSSWALAHGVTLDILRFQNVYGPGQSLVNSYTGIVPYFSRIARVKERVPLFEDGAITRDFIFIDDAADAIVKAVTDRVVGKRVFDIGSGVATSILELAEMITMMYDAPAPLITGQFRHGDVRHSVCEITRATEELNWTPRKPLWDGLRSLCQWIDNEVGMPSRS